MNLQNEAIEQVTAKLYHKGPENTPCCVLPVHALPLNRMLAIHGTYNYTPIMAYCAGYKYIYYAKKSYEKYKLICVMRMRKTSKCLKTAI